MVVVWRGEDGVKRNVTCRARGASEHIPEVEAMCVKKTTHPLRRAPRCLSWLRNVLWSVRMRRSTNPSRCPLCHHHLLLPPLPRWRRRVPPCFCPARLLGGARVWDDVDAQRWREVRVPYRQRREEKRERDDDDARWLSNAV